MITVAESFCNLNIEPFTLVAIFRELDTTGISSHADNTVIVGNTITNAAGAGVRVGTTVPDETGHFHGIDNTVGFLVDGKLPLEDVPTGWCCSAVTSEETYLRGFLQYTRLHQVKLLAGIYARLRMGAGIHRNPCFRTGRSG